MSVHYSKGMQKRRLKAFWASVDAMKAQKLEYYRQTKPHIFEDEGSDDPSDYEIVTPSTPL